MERFLPFQRVQKNLLKRLQPGAAKEKSHTNTPSLAFSRRHFDYRSQWYVYPRDMCIPAHISLVICVSLQYGCQWNVYPLHQPIQPSVGFSSVFFVNFANHRQRDYKWFKITSNTIDKRARVRVKIIAKLSLASLLLRGPQCWCKLLTFVLAPLLIQRDYNSYVTSRVK